MRVYWDQMCQSDRCYTYANDTIMIKWMYVHSYLYDRWADISTDLCAEYYVIASIFFFFGYTLLRARSRVEQFSASGQIFSERLFDLITNCFLIKKISTGHRIVIHLEN